MKKDKITLSEIIDIIVLLEKKKKRKKKKAKDQDGVGKNSFRDVMIARYKASGMSHEDAVEKAMKYEKMKYEIIRR